MTFAERASERHKERDPPGGVNLARIEVLEVCAVAAFDDRAKSERGPVDSVTPDRGADQ